MSDDAWHMSRTRQRSPDRWHGDQPTPLSQEKSIGSSTRSPVCGEAQPKFVYKDGEQVRIVDGPFSNFTGTVEEVNHVPQHLKSHGQIFGRFDPVELDFLQVEKI